MGLQFTDQSIGRLKFVIARLQLQHRVLMHSLQLLVGAFRRVQVSVLGCELVRCRFFEGSRLLFEVTDIVISILHLSLFLGQVTPQGHIYRVLGIEFALCFISSLTLPLELELSRLKLAVLTLDHRL